MTNGLINPGMVPPQPLLSGDQIAKLYVSEQQHAMAVEEHRAKKAIDDAFDACRQARYAEYRKSRAMACVVVSERPDGTFWYGFDDDGKDCKNKEVFPTTFNFSSKLYEVSSAGMCIMEVSFDRGSKTETFRINPYAESAEKVFGKKLLSKGVGISVGRTFKEDVLTQVLSMLINSASSEELPPHHGWYRKADGSFCFAGLDQLTLEEVASDEV